MEAKIVQKLLDDIVSKKRGFCLICGKIYNNNVCLTCEGINEARKVYYYANPVIKQLKENNKYSNDILKKIIDRKLEYYRNKITYSDLSCYNEQEKKEYFEAYKKEIDLLGESEFYFNYAYKILDTNKFNPTFTYDYMRQDNINKYCNKCTDFPCRRTRDTNFDVGIIKICSNEKINT